MEFRLVATSSRSDECFTDDLSILLISLSSPIYRAFQPVLIKDQCLSWKFNPHMFFEYLNLCKMSETTSAQSSVSSYHKLCQPAGLKSRTTDYLRLKAEALRCICCLVCVCVCVPVMSWMLHFSLLIKPAQTCVCVFFFNQVNGKEIGQSQVCLCWC